MELTDEQKQVVSFIKANSNTNIGIEASAGCGKTSTLLECLKQLPIKNKVKFYAFSNVIANELKEKVPSTAKVSTVHATGYSVLNENCNRLILSEGKVAGFVSKYAKKNPKLDKKFIHHVTELLQKHSLTLLDLSDESLTATCNRFSINVCPSWYVYVREVQSIIDKYNEKNLNTVLKIDFNDMVVLPIKYDLQFTQYDTVFMDEAQDMGECHKEILLRSVKPNGRFVVVYDRRQNIFSFASADIRVLDGLLLRGNASIYSLSYSFRCAKSIVSHCLSVYGNFKPFKDNKQGDVKNGSIKDIQGRSEAVLCRNTKPLFDVYAYLAGKGISSYIKGKDFGQELIKLLKKYRGENPFTTAMQLDNYLSDIENSLFGVGVSKPKLTKKYIAEYEKVIIIKKVLANTNSVSDSIKKLTTIFTEKGKGIPLMTIHKSKGLEFDSVFVVRNDLLPSKYAETKDEIIQERNLDWVLRSRAKNKLTYITDFIGDAKIEQVQASKLHKDSNIWV